MTKKMNDGGPAFPMRHLRDDGVEVGEQPGMSLRDWFAGQALAGIIVAVKGSGLPATQETTNGIAATCYVLADAMLIGVCGPLPGRGEDRTGNDRRKKAGAAPDRAGVKAPISPSPQPVVLHCPQCGKQHLDVGVGEWAIRPHKTHLCQATPEGPTTGCGYLWRPSALPTVGIARGSTSPSPEQAGSVPETDLAHVAHRPEGRGSGGVGTSASPSTVIRSTRLREIRAWLEVGRTIDPPHSYAYEAASDLLAALDTAQFKLALRGEIMEEQDGIRVENEERIEWLESKLDAAKEKIAVLEAVDINRLKAERARLREALKPFAKYADALDRHPTYFDDSCLIGPRNYPRGNSNPTVGDVRTARAAMAADKEPTP